MNQNISELYKDVSRPMTKEDKAKWLAALRSGEYAQGNSILFRKGKYCCLGVANKVCKLRSASYGFLRLRTWEEKFLPMLIQRILSNINNREDYSFSEIADYIEANTPTIAASPFSRRYFPGSVILNISLI